MSYSRRWDCLVCDESQETIDMPKVCVCRDCLMPLAQKLCRESLACSLAAEGVDADYWIRKADIYAGLLVSRATKRAARRVTMP